MFHGGSSFRKFSKFFFSKFQKCPKSFPKVSKRVLNVFWGNFLEKFFCPVFRGGSSFQKFSKKIFSKFQKCPKVFPKVSKRVLNMFWGKFFEKFYAQCSMEGRVFENFPIFFFKIPKMPKIVRKSIQTGFERVLGQTFRNFFCPVFRGGSSFRKFSQKIFSKFQKCPKVFSKVSKRVLNMFWGKFFEKFYAQCSMEGRVFENFPRNQKILKIQKCPKVFPKVSKRVLG